MALAAGKSSHLPIVARRSPNATSGRRTGIEGESAEPAGCNGGLIRRSAAALDPAAPDSPPRRPAGWLWCLSSRSVAPTIDGPTVAEYRRATPPQEVAMSRRSTPERLSHARRSALSTGSSASCGGCRLERRPKSLRGRLGRTRTAVRGNGAYWDAAWRWLNSKMTPGRRSSRVWTLPTSGARGRGECVRRGSRARREPLPVSPIGCAYELPGARAIGLDAPQGGAAIGRLGSPEQDPIALG